MKRSHFAIALVTTAVLTVGACWVIFAPARGARDDLGQVRTDLHASRGGIYATLHTGRRSLAVVTTQLKTTERSLAIQQRGLTVAKSSEQVARTTSNSTEAILRRTGQALSTVRRVIRALGPLRHLRGQIDTVVRSVQAGAAVAHAALGVAHRTLSTGRAALVVAQRTLAVLQQSRNIQLQQLQTARRTLRQTVEINHKIPTPPVFPTTATHR
jgi:hypothetical protein